MAFRGTWMVVLGLIACTEAAAQAYSPADCAAMGHARTRLYYVTGEREYRTLLKGAGKDARANRVCFTTFRDAENAGYRRLKAAKSKKPDR
jgi:hypothetical protein